ncbi:hypothetical protein SAMN05216228_10065 [Rhizobium tibeticum]|uniref:Uncharacterized protein n=2 Tax=Rhizobium tibeticum TaxID=501024 RepID=A0A1H8I6A1_9HYPH|nr:hypothetical protein RTCCBAU85039_1795 [Rhizobium tibeticum]SEN63368.1 hypothetical protein SAMN05216228_10065 [Rhizobium tibeticum]
MTTSRARYSWLLTMQAIGSASLLSQCYPLYSRLLDDPGHVQVYADMPIVTVLGLGIALVQSAHWYRVFKVALPVRDAHVVLGQLVLFTSRLAFIIASALFSLVLFRHLPEIDFGQHWGGYVWRGLLLLAVLFSVFCFTTELERLGLALRGQERTPDD